MSNFVKLMFLVKSKNTTKNGGAVIFVIKSVLFDALTLEQRLNLLTANLENTTLRAAYGAETLVCAENKVDVLESLGEIRGVVSTSGTGYVLHDSRELSNTPPPPTQEQVLADVSLKAKHNATQAARMRELVIKEGKTVEEALDLI